MKDKIEERIWSLKRAWWRRKELPWEFAANHAPKRLVYWCLIRAGVHASTGRFSSAIVPDITMMESIERWFKHMEGEDGNGHSTHADRIPVRP